MEPKRPGLPSVQSEYHNTGRGALEQGCWRNEGRHCGGRHEEGRVALLEWVLQRPPLRHGSHLLSQQNSISTKGTLLISVEFHRPLCSF